MILGIGSDMVSIHRVERLITDYGDRFIQRILSKNEIKDLSKLSGKSRCAFVAKRFAAKEAVSKALGTGISGGIRFTDIEVLNSKTGRPRVVLSNKAEEALNDLKQDHGRADIAITITDEPPYAQAMVIISGQKT